MSYKKRGAKELESRKKPPRVKLPDRGEGIVLYKRSTGTN